MRWLALVLVIPLLACESRVIVTRSPSPQSGSPSTTVSGSPAALPSSTPRSAPARLPLQEIPTGQYSPRLISYERGGDIGQPTVRFVLTSDGRVITDDGGGELLQRRLTPSGAAAMLLRAIETGLFERDADHVRVARPGTTPPAQGTTVLMLVVLNGRSEIRVSLVPTGQPDDEHYERSDTREKLTDLARGYEDLAWVTPSHWLEPTPRPYQPAFHRLFVLPQRNVGPVGRPAETDAVWPFLAPIDGVGGLVGGGTPNGAWRCAILTDADAQALSIALVSARAISRYAWGSRIASAELAWSGGGAVRLQLTPLLPHEPATCLGTPPPL